MTVENRTSSGRSVTTSLYHLVYIQNDFEYCKKLIQSIPFFCFELHCITINPRMSTLLELKCKFYFTSVKNNIDCITTQKHWYKKITSHKHTHKTWEKQKKHHSMNVSQNTMNKPTYIFPCIFHPQSKLVLVCRSKTERWANELAENKRIMYIYFFPERERI